MRISDWSSDVCSSDLLKTPDVSLSASSIGATVNVEFPKPFDHPGMRIAVTGSGSLQDGADKIAPSIGALFSDTFANDTVGILVDAIYTRHDTQSNRVYVSGWPGGYYAPREMTPPRSGERRVGQESDGTCSRRG